MNVLKNCIIAEMKKINFKYCLLNILSFSVCCLLSTVYCISQPQQNVNPNGYNKFYYENGNISSEGMMRDGKPDGYWKTYSPNGKRKSEGNRKDFELDSLWKFYSADGKLQTEINYKKGKKDGMKHLWSDEGFIVSEESFSADAKQGISLLYYSPDDTTQKKGKLKMKIPFEKGKENGTAYEFDKDGTIITILEYRYGVLQKQERINRKDKNNEKQGAWKEFFENGKVKSEVNYSDGKKNGYTKTYSENGSLLNVEKYFMDSVQKNAPELTTKLEVRNEYYPDGTLKKTGTYLNGVAEGIQKEFSPEGKSTSAKIFKEGILSSEGMMDDAGNYEGVWKEYHFSGQLKSRGEYASGMKVGEWIFYHPGGKVEQKGKYDKKGKAQGKWQWFYESGRTLREENYLNGKREDTLTEWNDSGKVITKGNYIDGNKEGKWFYQLQDYREEGNYKNDQKDGPWKAHYVDNNQIQFEGSFVEGIPDGKHVFYFHDGTLKEEGKYVAGNKEGNWNYYNPDGTVLLTVTFNRGKEIKFDGAKVKPLLPGENWK